METPTLVLIPELVPSPLWGISGFRLLPDDEWRAIRAAEVTRAGNACEVCGRSRPRGLVCHEVWHHAVEEGIGTAVLTGLRVQCRRCDEVTHFGLAESRGHSGRARRWLVELNGIDDHLADAILEVAYERHAQLSAVPRWRVRIAAALARRHPPLRAVARDVGVQR